MGKFKLNKKHSFIFVVALLLFSLNLNTFAATGHSVHLGNSDFEAYYVSGKQDIDCTSFVQFDTVSVTVDGTNYNATRFLFPYDSLGYERFILSSADLGLYTDTRYNYNFYVRLGADSNSKSSVNIAIFYYLDGEYYSSSSICDVEFDNGSYFNVSGFFSTPDISGNVTCALLCSFYSNDTSSSVTNLRITITDLVFTLDDPLVNGTPINTPSTEELENTLNEYEDVMSQLPQVNEDELEDLMTFDFDSFSDGLSFVRDLFDRTMNIFQFNAVLALALTIGLATYIIGRKVG